MNRLDEAESALAQAVELDGTTRAQFLVSVAQAHALIALADSLDSLHGTILNGGR